MDNKEYFEGRRSVRNFSSRPVDADLIKEIIEEASHAPTTGNMQLYSIVVTSDPATLKQLAPCHFSQPAMTNAPMLLTVCADFHRTERWCRLSQADPGFDNFQSFIAAMLDATIVAQQIVTIAEMRGLGTCYLGTTAYNAPEIARVLGMKQGVVPVITISIGWPEGKAPVSDRLPVEAVMHIDKYHEPTDDEIRLWYAEKESLPENIRFMEENHKQTLAQVYTDVRYPRANSELFSKTLYDWLPRAGFPWPNVD